VLRQFVEFQIEMSEGGVLSQCIGESRGILNASVSQIHGGEVSVHAQCFGERGNVLHGVEVGIQVFEAFHSQ